MDRISSEIIASSVIGPVGTTFAGSESRGKKKNADNKKVEKKESGLL